MSFGVMCARSDALALQRLVPALDLAVRLRIIRGRSDVRHARDAHELLEIAGNELRAIVGDDSRLRFLPAVEHGRPHAQFLAQFRHWHFVNKMPPQDGYFLG